jgi:hypothetical protein
MPIAHGMDLTQNSREVEFVTALIRQHHTGSSDKDGKRTFPTNGGAHFTSRF